MYNSIGYMAYGIRVSLDLSMAILADCFQCSNAVPISSVFVCLLSSDRLLIIVVTIDDASVMPLPSRTHIIGTHNGIWFGMFPLTINLLFLIDIK